jgi:hypothetical protein
MDKKKGSVMIMDYLISNFIQYLIFKYVGQGLALTIAVAIIL